MEIGDNSLYKHIDAEIARLGKAMQDQTSQPTDNQYLAYLNNVKQMNMQQLIAERERVDGMARLSDDIALREVQRRVQRNLSDLNTARQSAQKALNDEYRNAYKREIDKTRQTQNTLLLTWYTTNSGKQMLMNITEMDDAVVAAKRYRDMRYSIYQNTWNRVYAGRHEPTRGRPAPPPGPPAPPNPRPRQPRFP